MTAAPPRGAERDRRGEQIGAFLLEDKLGEGGMGVVYAALDLGSGRKVAVKVLSATREGDPRRARRFRAEAEAIAALEHPAIVRYVAHGTTPSGEPFLAMEWLEGEVLSQRLQRQGLRLDESVALARRVAEALSAAHARGVVHRDIKPSNLFLVGGEIDRVTVIDFGIAHLPHAPHAPRTSTVTGVVLGTPGYMAPEQARGARDIDARADIFSLGAVLFECIAGRPAFFGDHALAVLAKLLLEEPSQLGELRADVPAELSALVARMLAKDPAARPESAAELAGELAALSSVISREAPGEAMSPRAAPPAALPFREQRLMSLIVTGAGPSGASLSSDELTEGEQIATAIAPTQDVVDSAEIAERLTAAAALLGARVERLLDDSLLLILTGKGAATDQATRAARAALRCRKLAPDVPLALVSGLGDPSDRLLVGPLLDRAAALLALPASGVRIDRVTASLLDVRFEIVSPPSAEGAELPSLSPLELLGEREIGEGARTLLGHPSPFVGRERELQTLEALLRESVEESVARPVLVTAPAGAGKSRLRDEFVRAARLHGEIEIWVGRADPMGAGSAFALLASALRGATGVLKGEPLSVRRQKLSDRIGRHVEEKDRARVAAFLGELISTPFAEEDQHLLPSARRSPSGMAEQVRRAWEDFITAECAAHPVLLVLEDLHWGDLPSVKLVDAALGKLKDSPFMVLSLGRPDVHDLFPRLWASRNLQEIPLGDLGRRAAERLVRHALGASIDAAVVARIVARAGGNAFYLEELIRAVAEGQGDALPETVLSMVQARLDALHPEARRALRAASVFGEAFWQRGVATLLGGEERNMGVGTILAELVEQEVLVRKEQSKFPGEEEFAFRHALLREGAYARSFEADRELGHKLAAAWLTQAGESDPMVLAEHFEQGGEPTRAIGFYLQASEQAQRGQDLQAVMAGAERGIRCGATGEERALLLTLICDVHLFNNDFTRCLSCADAALSLATPGSKSFCWATMTKVLSAFYLGAPGPLMEAIVALQGAQPEPEGVSAFVLSIALIINVLLDVGQIELAEACSRRMERIGAPLEAHDPMIRGWLAYARGAWSFQQGDAWAALGLFRRAAASFVETGEPRHFMIARLREAFANLRLGAFSESQQIFEEVVRSGAAESFVSITCKILLSVVKAERGAWGEALLDATALLDAVTAAHNTSYVGALRLLLARLQINRGDLPAAEREALAAIELFALVPKVRAVAWVTLAQVRVSQRRPAEALALLEQAMAVGRSLSLTYVQAGYLALVQVEALEAAGDHARARETLAAARAELLALAEKIGDPALRRSFLEAIPEHGRIMAEDFARSPRSD